MKNSYYRQLRAFSVAAVLLVVGASSALAQWTLLPSLPAEVSWPQVAIAKTAKDRIYSFGGLGAAYYNTAHYIDVDGGQQWNAANTMPASRFGGYAGTVNNKIYLLGGLQNGNTLDLTVQEFDPNANTYTAKAQLQAPMVWSAGAVVGDKIYLIAGATISGQNLALSPQTWVYDVTQDSWTKINDAPIAARYLTATAIGNTIYLMGGGEDNAPSNKAWKGTISGNTISWAPIADLPVAMNRPASGVLGGKVYFATGAAGSAGASAKMWFYNEAQGKWERSYPLPTPTYNGAMVSDGTSLYFIGGNGNPNVYKFTPPASPVAVATVSQNIFVTSLKTSQQKFITFKVRNNGLIPLTGTIDIPSPAANWLSATATTVNLLPEEEMTVNMTVSSANVPVGDYNTEVQVKTNDWMTTSIPVKVWLFVRDNTVQQPARVTLEEASGAWCGPCGAYGVPMIEQLEAQYGDKLTVLSYHNTGGRGAAADTMATQETELIGSKLDINAFPGASVQRKMTNGSRYVDWQSWTSTIANIFAAQPNAPVALDILDYTYNSTTRMVTAKLKLTTAEAFLLGSDGSLRVTAVMLEDSIRSPQYQATANPFYHMAVAQSFGPDINGQVVALPQTATVDGGNVLVPGAEVEITMSFLAKDIGYPSRAHVAFLVHINYGTEFGPMLQSEVVPLVQISSPALSLSTDKLSQTVKTQTEAIFTTSVKNLTNAPLTLEVQRTQNDIANDWTAHFCIDNDCKGDNEHTGSAVLQPNQTALVKVHVNTGTVEGDKGEVSLRFIGGNVDQTIKYTTTNETNPSGSVGMTAVAGNGLRLEQNVPNPASGISSFGYYLPTAGNVTVELFTMNGQKVMSLPNGRQEVGNHSVAIDATSLPNGIYTVVLNVNGTRVTRTMTVVH